MRKALMVLVVMAVASPAYADDPPSGIIVRQPAARADFRSFAYSRLGYGAAFADEPRTAPAFGFGYRGETDSFALDVSFLNFMIRSSPYGDQASTFSGSVLRLQVLRFVEPEASRSMYLGGGLSWGVADVGRGLTTNPGVGSWHGSGLQAEFTTGYEFRGNTPLRTFIQADLGLPLFRAAAGSYTFGPAASGVYRPTTVERRYIPSVVLSFGVGWDTKRRP